MALSRPMSAIFFANESLLRTVTPGANTSNKAINRVLENEGKLFSIVCRQTYLILKTGD